MANITVVDAPYDAGTFTIKILEDGISIASLSGSPVEGAVSTLMLTVMR